MGELKWIGGSNHGQAQHSSNGRFAVRQSASLSPSKLGSEVDNLGNNVAVKEFLEKAQSTQLLSKVAESGLLSKAQEAGISLSKLEPLLNVINDNPDVLILVESTG